jgi:formate hydrogenlyase regulatory protein HycA
VAIPDKIKIKREEGYRTHHIGRFANGDQFMGFVVTPGGSRNVKWYAVLHRFDASGKHLGTDHFFLGRATWARELDTDVDAKLAELLKPFGPITYCDIEVGLFSVDIDGYKFGLVDASVQEEGYERIDLVPNDLAFFTPWDGYYDT